MPGIRGKGVGMAHPNEELIRRGFEAFSKGDMETLRNEIFASDVKYHVPGKSPISGDYDGIDAVLGFFGKIFELTGGDVPGRAARRAGQ